MNTTKSRCSGRVSSSCSTIDTSRVTAKRHERHVMWKSCYISNTQTYAWQYTKCNMDILYYYYNTKQSGYNLTPIKAPHNPQSIYWRIKVWKIRIHGKIMWSESLLQSSIFNMKVYTVMARELASIVVDCGFVLRSDQTKDYKTTICYFSDKYAALKRKSKDWLARNQCNVSEWGDMSIQGLLFQWARNIKIQV